MIRAVLFDLDGTLLPLNEKLFIELYFGKLGKKFTAFGYDPKSIVNAVWAGTKAMLENDGTNTNEEVFWPAFFRHVEGDHDFFESTFLNFYTYDFDIIQMALNPSTTPRKIIDELKRKGYLVLLATNPLFPRIATEKRIRWAGLDPTDFEFVTTYENFSYSKPNLGYYKSLLEKHHLNACECLMVGNDAHEDMISSTLGLDVFLLTDCLNNEFEIDINQYKNGSMDCLYEYIIALPEVSVK